LYRRMKLIEKHSSWYPALNATHFKAYRCILLRNGVLLRSAKQNWLLNL